jgi:hypothetical protein
MSAEDWPVQALSENNFALEQMRAGINRHYIFASNIFGVSAEDLKKIRTAKVEDGLYTQEQIDTADMQYTMGKRGRHSNNYGMQPARLSEALAAEGFTVPVESCKNILNIIDRLDPNVKRVFHKYIQDELTRSTHMLQTPLGRERAFLGLRSGERNYSILNEAYSYIPQSTVGDITGLAVLFLHSCNNYVLQDGHDSICQELPDNERSLRGVFNDTKTAFDRVITFHNGIEIIIPIEGQIGYDWKHKVALKEYTEDGLMIAYKELKEKYGHPRTTADMLHASTEVGVGG